MYMVMKLMQLLSNIEKEKICMRVHCQIHISRSVVVRIAFPVFVYGDEEFDDDCGYQRTHRPPVPESYYV